MSSVAEGMAIAPERVAGRTRRPRFFQITSALLLLAVLAGFGPTYFFRPATSLPPMHWFLWLHGTVLTSWFLISLVQTSLVAARRTDLHRRLGVLGAWIAVGVVAVGIYAIWSGPHDAATGTNGFINPAPGRMGGGPFLDAIGGIALFAVFVTAAILLRRKVEFHRRLMLMASIAIIFPAAGRIPIVFLAYQLPIAVAILGGAIAAAYCVGLPIALLVYDLVTRRRRPHPATIVALVAYFPIFFAQFIFGNAPAVQAMIRALE